MPSVVVWMLVALVAAGVVLAVVAAAGSSQRGLLADLRGGLRRDGRPGVLRSARRDLAAAAAVEPSRVEAIFEVGVPTQHDYLDPDDVAGRVLDVSQRAGRVASRGAGRVVKQLTRR